MTRIYVLLALVAVLGTSHGGAYLKGRFDGKSVAEEAAREREQQRLAEVEELERSIEQLRRDADADPDAERPAVGVDSVRRINSID